MSDIHVPGIQANPIAYVAGASSGRSGAHVRLRRTHAAIEADRGFPALVRVLTRFFSGVFFTTATVSAVQTW